METHFTTSTAATVNGAPGAAASVLRPVHEVRLGRIKASLWANVTETGTRYNVTVARLYKDAENRWKTSDSFGRDDLPLLCKVLDLAHTWAFQQDGAV